MNIVTKNGDLMGYRMVGYYEDISEKCEEEILCDLLQCCQ